MKTGLGYLIAYIAIWVLCLFGWGNNLYRLTQCDFDTPLKAEVIRGVGVVMVPIGIVLGYVDIEDK